MPRTLEPTIAAGRRTRTPLNRTQIVGFWGAWAGWTLDGMDSFIYALVLAPALTELLPRSGYAATPANVGLAGSILFALFLVGWGLSFIWGPLADRFGRTKVLAATIFTFAIFTGLAATSHTVWELGVYRFLAGVGIGGEWALAGTYVAEAWPEDRRKMGAGYLQTGYYAGFFIAAALFWPRRTARAQDAADAFDRRIVTLLAFGPGVAMILLTALSGRGAIAMWGYPLWLYVGLWLVLTARTFLDHNRLTRLVAAWAAVFANLEV